MKSFSEALSAMLTWGTRECGFLCAVAGAVLAVLLLTVGFWKTLLVVLFCAAGAFIGGVHDKEAFVKKLLNRLIPDPNKSDKEDE